LDARRRDKHRIDPPAEPRDAELEKTIAAEAAQRRTAG